MPDRDSSYRVRKAYALGERRPQRLIIIANGPLAWGRSCPFCSFNIVHRKQRGGGNQWGNVAKANAALADHIRREHADKLEKAK